MSLTLDPDVAEALAPMAAPIADQTTLPAGDALLGRAGVEVEFHLRPGVPHLFDLLAPASDGARRAIADRVRVLASP